MICKNECTEWLAKFLSQNGAMGCEAVRQAASKAGFSRKNLRNARYEIGVKTITQSAWALPEDDVDA